MSIVKNQAGTLRIRWLLAILVVLVIMDGIVSQLLIGKGLGHEGNPFLESLVGERIFIVIKALGAILCAFILWDIYKRWPKLALVATSSFVAIYSGIVIWNTSIFLLP